MTSCIEDATLAVNFLLAVPHAQPICWGVHLLCYSPPVNLFSSSNTILICSSVLCSIETDITPSSPSGSSNVASWLSTMFDFI